jgi:hypothetical protein
MNSQVLFAQLASLSHPDSFVDPDLGPRINNLMNSLTLRWSHALSLDEMIVGIRTTFFGIKGCLL